MIILALIKAAILRTQKTHTDAQLYKKLSRIDPHLLNDMGIRLDKGQLVSTRTTDCTHSSTAHLQSQFRSSGG